MCRRSSRTYDSVLSDADSRQIDMFLSRLPKRHFGKGMVGMRRIDCGAGATPPGTYGCISGAHHYVVSYTSDAVNNLTRIDCGMISELMALYATQAGIGTCLMTGTIRDSAFARDACLGGGDSLLLASPLGRVLAPCLTEKLIGRMSRSGTRMPKDRIVFSDRAFTIPWKASPDDYALQQALDGLCQAPSAYNRQPWRVVVCDNHIEIHNSESDSNSWIGIGCAITNYCAMIGIRSDSLDIDGTDEQPIIIAPRPI